MTFLSMQKIEGPIVPRPESQEALILPTRCVAPLMKEGFPLFEQIGVEARIQMPKYSMPEKIEVNRIVIPIMPGARNWI